MALNTITKPIVLLTRQHRFLGNTAAILHRLDYQPTHVPTLKVDEVHDLAVKRVLEQLDTFTDVIFVSRNAVEFGLPLIAQYGGMPPIARVMAVGAETAKQLYRHGIDAHFPDHGQGAEALLKVDTMQDLRGSRVLIVRGELGLDWPAEEMRKRGAEVIEAKCYRQSLPSASSKQLHEILDQRKPIEGVFVHSQQSLIHLIELAGSESDQLLSSTLVAGSNKIAQRAKEFGWTGAIEVAESPSNKHMMIAFSR
ncbi:uroporphyrinogen-III synthase [Arenicella chitinivorans]|nr:uroporphyrinogen-III synthase [Arenicella chitinivorans]